MLLPITYVCLQGYLHVYHVGLFPAPCSCLMQHCSLLCRSPPVQSSWPESQFLKPVLRQFVTSIVSLLQSSRRGTWTRCVGSGPFWFGSAVDQASKGGEGRGGEGRPDDSCFYSNSKQCTAAFNKGVDRQWWDEWQLGLDKWPSWYLHVVMRHMSGTRSV